MKPAPFGYVVARDAGEVVTALADGRARVLAGGQSLVLAMNLRIARPERVVDINRVGGFDRLETSGGVLRVGPLVRHRAFERQPGAAARDTASAGPAATGPAAGSNAGVLAATGALGRLLALVAPYVGHPPIRTRGTMLGSLAEAHPAAEWPAVVTALDGTVELTGPDGSRTVAAGDFFTGPFRTARRPEELLSELRLPLLPAGTGVGFVEHRRTEASFAQLAVVATLAVRDDAVAAARIGLVNGADRPVRAHAAEAALLGRQPVAAAFAAAARVAGDVDAQPRPQPHADTAYQRHAVAVLVRRALEAALADLGADAGTGNGR